MPNNADNIQTLTRLIDGRMTELDNMKRNAEAEKRRPTAEECARADEIIAEVGNLHRELVIEKQEFELRGKLNTSLRAPVRPELVLGGDELQRRFPGLPPKEMRFDSFGDQLMAVVRAANPSLGIKF